MDDPTTGTGEGREEPPSATWSMAGGPPTERSQAPLPEDADELAAELKFLREEVDLLRRRLETAPGRIRTLEERLLETKAQLQGATAQNAKLTETLRAARDQLASVREEVERLSAPPQAYATFLERDEDAETVTVVVNGRKMEVTVGPEVDVAALALGQEVRLNEAMNVVAVGRTDDRGDVMTIAELLDDGRALVLGHTDDERVVLLSDRLREGPLKAGDSILVDLRSNTALERIPKAEVEQLILEQVPDITYDQIGGLGNQVEAIRDAIELPYLHADLFVEHELRAPKGILLYGPPGCGKTMIAKAVANSLAQRVRDKTGREDVKSYFLNVKGPELLNKYVGETERQIRVIFQRAREKAAEGFPVIVFFDEMESLFRTRGSGVSSDVETTIVPQLLAEIDGVESLKDVVVIGASNREDMIDPAILRPGRLDVKIKVDRPDADAAREIFGIYLHEDLPLHADDVAAHGGDAAATVADIIERTVTKMYAADKDNEFLEVTYANGEKEVLYFKDFNSGAMIENVVARAKKLAIKRLIATEQRGLTADDLLTAIRDEFRENEDLPNTTNPDDWARISGKKGERIVYVRTLVSGPPDHPGRAIENVNPGQYL
ncbi:proteasome ATPase [Nitriliruptor alkaliphilus]|uniref:proteasome ATPase n=1 Tax=Nitriliruptor alkaliphilus TaxID=427918 RepID=UPI000A65451D|nr:proteasome ATPase [Nitriliruptor alkaliphilus]